MFCVEYLLHMNKIQNRLPKKNLMEMNWIIRTLGIITWPIYLIIFIYHFFKELFK